jgi:altronate dehydratase
MSDRSIPSNCVRLHPDDNVVVAVETVETVFGETVPRGHKIATDSIPTGKRVRRYGQIIGAATCDIPKGAHVHDHNLGMEKHHQQHVYGSDIRSVTPAARLDSFDGFHRPTGKIGTRNYVGVVTSVNCAGSVAQFIAEAAERQDMLRDFPNVDGIVPIAHGMGCGMAGKGEGYDTLFRTITGFAQNPNFGAVLLLGLGCEVMQIPALVGGPAFRDQARFRHLTIQEAGGTQATVEAGLQVLQELLAEANKASRAPAPASALIVGLQCGGSDGLSGITANPALGAASDLLVAQGGTTILSETSEIYGAEHLLTRRAVSPEVGAALEARVAWWVDYCARNGGEMDNNPSPGNKMGGLTTILEKSLGAVAKSGTAPLNRVYLFAEPIDRPGFVFMDSPGYDPCSVTGQIASGANLIAFTTGRGSVSGYKPVPCIKIATNSEMYARMSGDMDVNCGEILSGVSIADKGREIYRVFLEIASGRRTKSEQQGFGGVEFVPWQIGAVM